MRDIFLDLSIRSVRLNFLRSLLACIGIVIGVVAISSMGMLGTNMQLSVKSQLSSDVNTIMISSDVVRTTSTAGIPVTQEGIDKSTLNDIKTSAGQNDVIPIHRTNTQFTLGSTDGRGSVYGFDPTDIPKFLTLQDGSELKGGSDALVGSSIASNFNMNIGSRIKIGPSNQANRPTVRVVGILASRGFASDGINTDNAIIVPDTWYTDTFGGKDVYDQVNVIMGDISKINDTEAAIDDKVNRRTQVVRISDASSRLSSISSTLGTITTFIMAIGSISRCRSSQHLQRDDDVGERAGTGNRYPPLHRYGKRRGAPDVPL